MRYMLLLYSNDQAREAMSAEEWGKAGEQAWAIIDEMTERGIFRGAEPLHPASTATTVRHTNGRVLVTDGPFIFTMPSAPTCCAALAAARRRRKPTRGRSA